METTTYLGITVLDEDDDFSPDWLSYERSRRRLVRGEPLCDLSNVNLSPEEEAKVNSVLSNLQGSMEQSYKALCDVREALAVAVAKVEPQPTRKKVAIAALKESYTRDGIIPSKEVVRFLLSGI
jgi:hypothetical protein